MYLKTRDGRSILLNLEALKKDKPGLSGLLNVTPLTFALFTLAPFLIRFGPGLGAIWTAIIAVMIIFGIIVYLRISIYRLQDPLAFDKARVIGFSSWIYYPGALLWLDLSGAPRKYLLLVALAWLISEAVSCIKLRAISDTQLAEGFKDKFSQDIDHNIRYDAPKEPREEFLAPDARSLPLWIIEILPTAILLILGPFLYLTSFMLRSDFQPRFLIVFAFSFAFATLTRTTTTEYLIVRRALKQKAASL